MEHREKEGAARTKRERDRERQTDGDKQTDKQTDSVRERGVEIESPISWPVDKIVCPYSVSRSDSSIVPWEH